MHRRCGGVGEEQVPKVLRREGSSAVSCLFSPVEKSKASVHPKASPAATLAFLNSALLPYNPPSSRHTWDGITIMSGRSTSPMLKVASRSGSSMPGLQQQYGTTKG